MVIVLGIVLTRQAEYSLQGLQTILHIVKVYVLGSYVQCSGCRDIILNNGEGHGKHHGK